MTEKNTPINYLHDSVENGLVSWLIDSSETFRDIPYKMNARKALLEALLKWGALKLEEIERGTSKMEEIDREEILLNFKNPSAYRSYWLKEINEQYDEKIEEKLEQIEQELKEANPPVIKLNVPGLKKTAWDRNLNLGRGSLEPNTPFRRQLKDNIIPPKLLKIIAETIAEKGFDFSGSNFRGADIRGADFSRANLYGADFSRANLYGADFSGADLKLTKLCRAKLYRANLSGADLYMANLSDADLRGAKFDKETILPNNLNTNSPLFPFSNKQINQLSESEKTKAIAFNDKFKKEKRTKILGMEIIGSGVFEVIFQNVSPEKPPSTIFAGIACEIFRSAIVYKGI
jgi:uncharacterized protein YjbI with pentapeptide repeats